MQDFDNFDTNGNGVVTASPQRATDDPVRFDGSIAERENDIEGNWEEIVGELMDHDLGEALDIGETGDAVIDRDDAVEALVEADDEQIDASTQWEATAVLEYLGHENIVELEDGAVTILRSFDDIAETEYTAMYNNWAAMFDTCIDRIEVAEERVEEARQRFENRREETTSSADVNPQQRKQELKQEIAQLVGGRSPEELDDGERQRVQNLRKQFYFYQSIDEIRDIDVPNVADRVQELAQVMERFSVMRDVMAERRDQFRQLAMGEAVYPESLIELADQYNEFLSSMSDTFSPADKMEDEDLGDFIEDIDAGMTDENIEAFDESVDAISNEVDDEGLNVQ
ncbi:MAG: hypothetical protein J07HB67_00465 [halophilic archaeon J07HB67]|jgi:hypothetical protein|nr:MAG: hypothetical protein J07HB67_00465 [halophilic archaeon J07HB67]